MTPYQELLNAVTQYYGAGSDEWMEIAKYGVSAPHLEEILSNIPGVSIVKNLNGSIRSFNFAATENITPGVETAVNSNVPAVMQTFDVPATTGIQEVPNAAGEIVKQVTFKSGMQQAGNFVSSTVGPAVAAVCAGITLGKTFDKLLYNFNPDFWDEHGMSTLNPDVWGDIIGTDTKGGRFLNMMLRTTPDHKTQAYMDENALAYMALYDKIMGVFNTGGFTPAPNQTTGKVQIKALQTPETIMNYSMSNWNSLSRNDVINKVNELTNYDNKLFTFTDLRKYGSSSGDIAYVSKDPVNINSSYNSEDKIDCYAIVGTINKYGTEEQSVSIKNKITQHSIHEFIGINIYNYIGNINGSSNYVIDGIGTQEGAVTPDISNAKTVAEVLDILKNTYPGLFENAVTQNVVQPDGTIKTYTYVPVAMPELDPDGNPISSTSDQAKPEVDPQTATENLLKTIAQIIPVAPPTNPPDTGKGHTPTVTPPTGSASALYAIYNPTLSEINAFGAWLWSDDFVDQIKKLFNDPMQAIIGLHKVYATPATSGARTIKVGYLDSGVSANVVSNQYVTIDCGTVSLPEYFHNVFDYSPYTQVNLYLPFIGIVPLDNADVMRSSIHIVYHVDVLSGACLAEVKVTRDGAGGTLYQYTGNASVTLPISSGSYMGIVSSIASIAGGIAGTLASGGAALPMIASAAGSALNARTKVEHSGGFSGNAGAMGGKIPYLIISRPQIELAANYRHYIGKPSNFTATLCSCHGYTEVIECHLENLNATNSELDEIDALLKGGVIV